MRRLMEQTEGFSVAAVCLSGETAIEAVKEWNADLIITDIRMSGMSGLELIARMKEEAGALHSIIVTGHKTFEYAKAAISLGIDAFITKPIDQQELRAALESIRKGHRSACADHLRQRLEAFVRTRDEEAFLYHMRRQIHAISALMDRAGLLTWDKVSVNDQIDESIISQDSYEEIREAAVRCWTRSMQERPEEAKNKDYHMFEQIRVFIEQNRSQNYSLQEICSIFKASPPYIRKVFKQHTGKSYNEYLLESKINYAVSLMDANPHMFVKDIADMLGYEQLYFGTLFKKVIGVSPSQYRSGAVERKSGGQEEG